MILKNKSAKILTVVIAITIIVVVAAVRDIIRNCSWEVLTLIPRIKVLLEMEDL